MYNLNIEKAVNAIKKSNAKKVLLQFPDGLKPKAKKVQDEILKRVKTDIFIWGGSCFGACDVPLHTAKQNDIDLIIQWGHAKWR